MTEITCPQCKKQHVLDMGILSLEQYERYPLSDVCKSCMKKIIQKCKDSYEKSKDVDESR